MLTITDQNGCTDTDVVTVTVNKASPSANAGPNRTTTCTAPTASLAGSGGGSYSWSNGAGTSATPTVNPATNTNYTLTVTSSNGCTDTDVTTVTVNETSPTANAGANFTTTCTTPTATLAGSGGGNYSWSNGAGTSATPTVNPGATANYTLTVTNPSNGCTDTDVTTVTVNKTAPTANAGANITLDCATTSGNFTATGGGTYSWSSPNGTSAVAGFSVSDTDTPGNYTVTVTAANGCTDTDVATLSIDQTNPVANAGADQTSSCAVPTVTLNGSSSTGAGITYAWTGTNVTGGANTSSATADAAGTYTLVVTGSNSCTDSDQVDVLPDLNVPTANAGTDQILDCNTTSVTLDGSTSDAGATITYAWTTGSGNITGTTATNTTTADLDGTYTITVTNTSNGCSSTDDVAVTQDTITPVSTITNSSYIIDCNNPTATFDASGSSGSGNSFNWTTSNGNIVSGGNTDSPTVDLDGTYSLSVTSANGCGNLNTTNVTVTMDTVSPTIQINIADTLTCNILQVTLDASGSQAGVTYNWTTVDGLISSGTTSSTPTVDSSGTYSLLITSSNGCTSTANTTVADSQVPEAHIVTNTTEGEVDLTVAFSDTSSGMGLTHYWDFGTDNMDFDTVSPTTYTYTDFQEYEVVLTVTDQYGCIATDTIIINALELSAIEVPNIFTPNGDGDNDLFNVKGGGIKNFQGNIMNRWGQIVYDWDSQYGGWDGRSVAGNEAAEGSYFYFITVDFNDGHSQEYTGHLMLKR
jgi:gliding motility-associated-like protein